jgi:hypothetical protein
MFGAWVVMGTFAVAFTLRFFPAAPESRIGHPRWMPQNDSFGVVLECVESSGFVGIHLDVGNGLGEIFDCPMKERRR